MLRNGQRRARLDFFFAVPFFAAAFLATPERLGGADAFAGLRDLDVRPRFAAGLPPDALRPEPAAEGMDVFLAGAPFFAEPRGCAVAVRFAAADFRAGLARLGGVTLAGAGLVRAALGCAAGARTAFLGVALASLRTLAARLPGVAGGRDVACRFGRC
ncbi:MAG: hypothetical protein GIX03_12050, partial [Candidatus Eremiobacteraeota bacterium]|nr:hypothetical protein [Candidatus Eremiobacteraeota bacterium]